jgi:Icc-related predicted phosphoesterase
MSKSFRVLCVSDLHGLSRSLQSIDHALEHHKPDLVLIAGDIAEKRADSVSYLNSLLSIIKKKHRTQVFAVHGNSDSPDIFDLLEATGISLHLQVREFGGYNFSGIGGLGDLTEPVLDEQQALRFNPANTVFVTHMPPRRLPNLTRNLPLVHVCGHTHSTERLETLNGVPIIRLKTAMLGRGAILELPSMQVKFVDL